MSRAQSRLPARQFAAAASMLILASAAMFSSIVWTATAARDLELVNEELLRLESLSTSIHKLGESAGAEREVRAELAAVQGLGGRRDGWDQWVAELAPLIEKRLRSRDTSLNEEIDRRLDALQEYELAVLEAARQKSQERRTASAAIFALVVALSLSMLAAAFRTLRHEIEAHAETADKFSTAFHGSSLPMAIVRASDGRLVEVNRSFERLLGGLEGSLAGRSVDALRLTLRGDPLSVALGRLARTGPLRDAEAELGLESGEVRSLLVSADTLTLKGVACAFACVHDITVRKRAEVALRDFAGALVRAEQKERRRLAQILHDSLQQTLAAASMHINLVLSRRPEEARESASAAAGILKEAVQTTRELSYELCPPGIARGSLGRSLRWLGDQMRSRHNLAVSVQLEHDPADLPDSVRDFLFGASRELLFNVVKHAKTPAAKLAVSAREGSLRVEVSDEGPGFDSGRLTGGLGLADIRERVGLFGGSLDIASSPGGGCRVSLLLPT